MPPPGNRSVPLVVLPVWFLLLRLEAFAGFACLSNPCVYGICMDDVNSTYSCYCIDGYTGVQCQTNWNECWSSPCKNGGTCIDGVASYNCTCAEGFIGDDCETNFDECDSNPCLNNGTCIDIDNGFNCICQSGYSGFYCEIDAAVCNSTEEYRCANGGLCIEGPGYKFTCICRPGWTGKLCQTQINECESFPCQNGAICIDLLADYSCACHFGYTGKNCEEKILVCEDNPCTNDALCLMEDDVTVCYCVPDYHGEKCQFQYDECQLGPRCMNGGTCIDGVDGFTCSCPPGLTGLLCECLILPNEGLDCTYIRLTSMYPTTTYVTENYTLSSDFTSTTKNITYISSPFSTEEYDFTTHSYTPKETTASFLSSSIHTETSTGFKVPNETETSTITDVTTPIDTLFTRTETSKTEISTKTEFISTETFPIEYTTMKLSTTESSSEIILTTLEPTTDTTSYEKSYTTREIPTIPVDSHHRPTLSTTEEYESTTETTQQTETPSVSTVTESISTSSEFTTSEFTTKPDIFTEVTSIRTEFTRSTNHTEFTDKTTTRLFSETTFYTTEAIEETTTMEPTEKTTTEVQETSLTSIKTEPSGLDLTTASTSTTSLLTTFLTEKPTEISIPVTIFTEKETTFSSTELSTPVDLEISTIPQDNQTVGPRADCRITPCRNGGTCVLTSEGPKCMCKFDSEGILCEILLGIQNAAFRGDSYLSHQITNKSGIKINLTTKTLSPNGLIFYSSLGKSAYMTLYIIDGMLKFQFSCGLQTMVLTEMELRVNTGFHMVIEAQLLYSKNFSHCNASLRLNETLTMSGDQSAKYDVFDKASSWLHFGSLPQLNNRDNIPTLSGFMGCMRSLMIDGKKRSIFKDAKDGYEITECDSLACLSSPCTNGATCVQFGEQWRCLCRNGYVGDTCEQSVCNNNPCLFGATCIPYTGGYICLCPLGKHGHLCELDLEIAQPSFSSSLNGYSSYAAYSIPKSLSHNMEMKFNFIPNTNDQISLLMFVGQDGMHDSTSDHMAVSFVKGYIMLTWNLGSGPRRIFTTKPITIKPQMEHVVKLGRVGRRSWLVVDNLGNVTGRSPGKLAQLDVNPLVFLGGYDSGNFSTLPHDLPLHTGFSGCIYDVEIKSGSVSVPLYATRLALGRSVTQCGTAECSEHACQNGGACLQHGPTFTCLCPDGWFGRYCTNKFNPCDSMRHNCSSGSTCVPLVNGYECDCRLGTTGTFCEKREILSDVSFTGKRSYLSTFPIDLQGMYFQINLQIRPLSDRGLIFFSGYFDGSSFVSLYLQGGILELRLSLEKRKNSKKETTITRSSRVLRMGEWHKVRAGRYGKGVFLWVDEIKNVGVLTSTNALSINGTPLFIGGLPDLSNLPINSISTLPVPFTGCVRQVSINGRHIPLNESSVKESRNTADCDGTPCGGDVCENGGTCWLDSSVTPHCSCLPEFSGDRCQVKVSCIEISCQNHGRCIDTNGIYRCVCPVGFMGDFCESRIRPLVNPQFNGDSYLVIEDQGISPNNKKRNSKMISKEFIDLSYVFLNVSTIDQDGMILWTSKGEEFLGIGIERGYLKLGWAWHTRDTFIVEIPAIGPISDGNWHSIAILSSPGNITILVDEKLAHSQINEEYNNVQTLITDGRYYIGGFAVNESILKHTRGLFKKSFSGCVQDISLDQENTISDFSDFAGENIGICNIFPNY